MLKKYCFIVTLPCGDRFPVYTLAPSFSTAHDIFNHIGIDELMNLKESVPEDDANFNEKVGVMTNCVDVEKMIVDNNCTGKRVTKELIDSRIQNVDYQTVVIAGQKLMFCGIKMDNGFVVVGKPATCIDPANWRDEIGQKVSYDNSFDEIWKLEAYRLMSTPSAEKLSEDDKRKIKEAILCYYKDYSRVDIPKVTEALNRAFCEINAL